LRFHQVLRSKEPVYLLGLASIIHLIDCC
jgi:hypothetical protein